MACNGQCNQNLASNNPASQYQRQKIIQKTVRVAASVYTLNLAALAAYRSAPSRWRTVEQAGTPYAVPPHIRWNQMSDRGDPSVQRVKTGSGSTYRCSSTRNTIVRCRPGATSPGGTGVDIKHNSYDRYLNRLKGRAPLRRGAVPPTYGAPIPFNAAYPIYGGKIVKTAIINDCGCAGAGEEGGAENDLKTFVYASPANAVQEAIQSVTYQYHVGDWVWVVEGGDWEKAQIVALQDATATVRLEGGGGEEKVVGLDVLMPFFQCDCDSGAMTDWDKILQYQQGDLQNYDGAAVCALLDV